MHARTCWPRWPPPSAPSPRDGSQVTLRESPKNRSCYEAHGSSLPRLQCVGQALLPCPAAAPDKMLHVDCGRDTFAPELPVSLGEEQDSWSSLPSLLRVRPTLSFSTVSEGNVRRPSAAGAGRDSMATTVWLALTLWLVMVIGELGIVTQSVRGVFHSYSLQA